MSKFVPEFRPMLVGDFVVTTESGRYDDYASDALAELLVLNEHVRAELPLGNHPFVQGHPLRAAVRKRDRLSDSVKIFAAMSIEAFLNLYGSMIFSDACFADFEPRSLKEKTRALLRHRHNVRGRQMHNVMGSVISIANSRKFVHPKSQVLPVGHGPDRVAGDHVPEVALATIEHLKMFYAEFGKLAPDCLPYMQLNRRPSVDVVRDA